MNDKSIGVIIIDFIIGASDGQSVVLSAVLVIDIWKHFLCKGLWCDIQQLFLMEIRPAWFPTYKS